MNIEKQNKLRKAGYNIGSTDKFLQNGREFKFRIWSFVDKAFHYFELEDYPSGIAGGASEPQQFTGLKDKNGKEIYEGDIMNNGNDIGPVVYDAQSASFYIKSIIILRPNEPRYMGTSYWGIVIGNIHENPELLK